MLTMIITVTLAASIVGFTIWVSRVSSRGKRTQRLCFLTSTRVADLTSPPVIPYQRPRDDEPPDQPTRGGALGRFLGGITRTIVLGVAVLVSAVLVAGVITAPSIVPPARPAEAEPTPPPPQRIEIHMVSPGTAPVEVQPQSPAKPRARRRTIEPDPSVVVAPTPTPPPVAVPTEPEPTPAPEETGTPKNDETIPLPPSDPEPVPETDPEPEPDTGQDRAPESIPDPQPKAPEHPPEPGPKAPEDENDDRQPESLLVALGELCRDGVDLDALGVELGASPDHRVDHHALDGQADERGPALKAGRPGAGVVVTAAW